MSRITDILKFFESEEEEQLYSDKKYNPIDIYLCIRPTMRLNLIHNMYYYADIEFASHHENDSPDDDVPDDDMFDEFGNCLYNILLSTAINAETNEEILDVDTGFENSYYNGEEEEEDINENIDNNDNNENIDNNDINYINDIEDDEAANHTQIIYIGDDEYDDFDDEEGDYEYANEEASMHGYKFNDNIFNNILSQCVNNNEGEIITTGEEQTNLTKFTIKKC